MESSESAIQMSSPSGCQTLKLRLDVWRASRTFISCCLSNGLLGYWKCSIYFLLPQRPYTTEEGSGAPQKQPISELLMMGGPKPTGEVWPQGIITVINHGLSNNLKSIWKCFFLCVYVCVEKVPRGMAGCLGYSIVLTAPVLFLAAGDQDSDQWEGKILLWTFH